MPETVSFRWAFWQAGREHDVKGGSMRHLVQAVMLGVAVVTQPTDPAAQARPPASPADQAPPSRASILRGEYGRYRANNDLLYYHLDIKADPDKQLVSGKNTIRFRMLQDDTRIQIDLYANLSVDKILLGTTPLKYERELGAVFIDFPETLKKGRDYSIDFYYSGTPAHTGRFGGFTFQKDPSGRQWIFTACEGEGSSLWWPSKDQWRDEVENMDISITVPSRMVEASNGRFVKKTDLADGFTRWDWAVHYPINSYNVSINATDYVHFEDTLGSLTLDFYATPENLDKARVQFAQAKPMIEAFKKFFGEYPFAKDGYKLIEVPYTGMEHQSAVTYGNGYRNGYGGRDWTGVGISPKFDFIIIHESGHEWFGNAVSAADASDMWIQEGWCTYLEGMYVEALYGKADGLKYVNGYKTKVRNTSPIVTTRGLHQSPRTDDQYFKGALFLNTLRSVVDDDEKWWAIVRGVYDTFKYHNIMTEDLVRFFNEKTRRNLTAVFDQYLRHTALPVLELKFDQPGSVSYRWNVDEPAFGMPVKVGTPDHWDTIEATTDWKTMKTSLTKETFQVATDLFYINVSK
ncbi:MAG TPA: M1 family metallopeptidase [Vicinamibacterales bacterium]|nr:M1 family metallopeptidase [Vicinamibacterales bacterium]